MGLPPPQPLPLHMPWLTFVRSLGDSHSLAYEFIVSSPSTPAHATWASKATMLTCKVGGCCGAQELCLSLLCCESPSWVRSLLHLFPKAQAFPDSTLATQFNR